MGYGIYEREDGRTAGYHVTDECDAVGCKQVIRLGVDDMCGRLAVTEGGAALDLDDPGCGKYFCGTHIDQHECPRPECATYSPNEELLCGLLKGHKPPCRDSDTGETFTSLSVVRSGSEPPSPVEVIAGFIAGEADIDVEQAMPQAIELVGQLSAHGYGFTGKGHWA